MDLLTNDISNDGPIASCSHQEFKDQIDQDRILALSIADQEAKRDQDCASDAALALILQKQFDLDHNNHLKKEEARLNGKSKVGVSLAKFRRTSFTDQAASLSHEDDFDQTHHDSDSELENDVNSNLAWDVFEQSEFRQRSRMMGRSGFGLDEDGNMITKHDIPTSSRKNMCRLMELKTDIQTGDAGGSKDDFKITNYVYNRLKIHSKKSSRRATQKLFDKNDRVNTTLLDESQSIKLNESTRAIVDGLLFGYKLEKLNGIVGHGKESIVLHATGRDHEDNPGQEVAVKIFKSNSNVAFKTRDAYGKSKCPSYKFDKPKSKNLSLNKWAERGFKHLKILRRANINCPEAISLKKHVLLMSFLGTNSLPSPQLKNANLSDDELKTCYEQVLSIMSKMYQECDLIHGDLSEYNLLWHKDQVYVIDVSQSMFASHPNANLYLYRDCENIIDFFRKSGLNDILEPKSLFTYISGKDLTDKDIELWAKIEDFPCNEKLMQNDENADKSFNKSDRFVQIMDSIEREKSLSTDADSK